MTWTWEIIDGTELRVYDHNDDLVDTITSSAGFTWDGYSNQVLEVMDQAAVDEFNTNGLTIYALQCLRHGSFDLIERR